MKFNPKFTTHFQTNSIHIDEYPNLSGHTTSDVVCPIHFSSTFAKPNYETTCLNHGYSRLSNPTREVIESKIACLEKMYLVFLYKNNTRQF